jgi:hypothetical protein
MAKIRKITAILALALVSATAQAQTRFMNEGETDILYREGVASYSDNNGLVATSWFLMRSKTTGEEGKWLVQVHCDSRLIRNIRYIEYNYGRLVTSRPENWNAPWRNPVPGAFESLFQQICYTR